MSAVLAATEFPESPFEWAGNSGIAVLLRLSNAPDLESVLPSTGDLLTHLLTISPHTHLLTITPLASLWQPR